MVYGSASMITSFDMKNITSANDLQAADQVYDTLVRKINHEIVGYLAESYEISDDGKRIHVPSSSGRYLERWNTVYSGRCRVLF